MPSRCLSSLTRIDNKARTKLFDFIRYDIFLHNLILILYDCRKQSIADRQLLIQEEEKELLKKKSELDQLLIEREEVKEDISATLKGKAQGKKYIGRVAIEPSLATFD